MNKKKPIRIMHIAQAAGGVDRYLRLLVKYMDPKSFEHIMVCSSDYDQRMYDKYVVAFEHVKMSREITKSDLIAVKNVRKLIKKYKPDVVYCHSSKAGAIGRFADIGIKNTLVYNAHGWAFNMRDSSQKKLKFYELIERILAQLTDKIICISEFEKCSALKYRICKNEKLVVINNGIDFDECNNIHVKTKKELGIPEDAIVVGTIGRLAPQKAPDIFIKMAKEVKKKIPNAFFVMVGGDTGDGQLGEALQTQIVEEGLQDSFCISGWVENPLDYLGLFDIATLLSRWEGFGLVLAEYMYMKKPIVATNIDAIPYVVGDAGILIDIDDYKKASESIVKICNDSQLRNRLVELGNERVKMFDAKRTASEHASLFRKEKMVQ